jgi:hypothetical protein
MKGISIFAGAGLVGLLFTVCHVEAGLFSKVGLRVEGEI